MRNKQLKILYDIFDLPVKSNIKWSEIEKMLLALGAEISEGSGSRVRIILNNTKAVFHRPHPRKETDKGAVTSMKRFLITAGINPKGQNL